MKKILFMIVLCAFVGFSTMSFAAATALPAAGTALGLTTFQPSPDVNMFADATTIGYGVVSKHIGGNATFESTHTDPSITETEVLKSLVLATTHCPSIP